MQKVYVDFHCNDKVTKNMYKEDNNSGLIQIVKCYSDTEEEMINNISIIEAQEMIKQLQEKIDYLKNTQRKY